MTDISKIRKNMAVIAADGRRIGFVKRMAGSDKIKLTSLSAGHGYDHLIPLAWVSEVDRYVYLNRASWYVAANWENVVDRASRLPAVKPTEVAIPAETAAAAVARQPRAA